MVWEQLNYINFIEQRLYLAVINDNAMNEVISRGYSDTTPSSYGTDIKIVLDTMSIGETKILTLSNGNTLELTRQNNDTQGNRNGVIKLHTTQFNETFQLNQYNKVSNIYLCYMYSNVLENGYICIVWINHPVFGNRTTRINYTINGFTWLNGSFPIEYNYVPINYITGNNKTLKLSMIKAERTNHGDNVLEGALTDIQRFTDSTNLFAFGSNLSVDEEKVLGYTSKNNYVTFKRTYNSDATWVSGELHYYENGVELTGLKQTNIPSMHDEGSTYSKVYFSLLLDSEHSACRPSIIWVYKATQGSDVDYVYNSFENNASIITDANQSLWFEWLASGYHIGTTEPYDYGGNSTPDSGDGQWDNSSETIDIPTIPNVSISDTGFVSVFNPTLSQVKALADYMWAGAFDVSLFKKVMANPMDSIIGFALIPCEPNVSGVDTVKVGNIDTGVSMNAVSNQFVDVDCGTLDLEECWGNYLDYAPYTKITLVLPFIGSVHLSPDDCMKKKIGIKYRIDILSGGCVAYVTCNGSVLYQFTGSCSAQLPITNLDYRGMISALISIGTTAVGVGSAIASGGITAPMVAVGVGNTANNVMNGKPNIQHGGSLGSTSGFLGTRIPYLIITRPRQCVPTGVNKFKGLPSLITSKLKNVTGFTQVHDIHLDDLPCSDAEKTELRSILESGVII